MEINRRSFIASLGGTGAVALMTPDEKADALEHYMESRLEESKVIEGLLGETQVTGDRLENLPITMAYTAEKLGELVTNVLPTIENQVILDIRTDRLPGVETGLAPRVRTRPSRSEPWA